PVGGPTAPRVLEDGADVGPVLVAVVEEHHAAVPEQGLDVSELHAQVRGIVVSVEEHPTELDAERTKVREHVDRRCLVPVLDTRVVSVDDASVVGRVPLERVAAHKEDAVLDTGRLQETYDEVLALRGS